jgi:hypothetical protein
MRLAHRKGLYDEIIGPGGKAAQAQEFLPSRREHDNWQHSCRFLRPQPETNFGARYAGQHPIENDKIGRRVGELSYGFVAAIDAFDDIAFGLEIVREREGQRDIALDDRDDGRAAADQGATVTCSDHSGVCKGE